MAGRFLTAGPPGKSLIQVLNKYFDCSVADGLGGCWRECVIRLEAESPDSEGLQLSRQRMIVLELQR